MREYTTEPAERATERPFNLPDQLAPAGNQALPNLQALGGVERAKSAFQANSKIPNQSAARKKLIVGFDEKIGEDDEPIVLAQATAASPRGETAGATDSAITVASDAAFNPECPVPTADGCGLAIGAEGRGLVISPFVFAPVLALGGGGGGGEPAKELPQKLQFVSGFGLGPEGKNIKIPLTNEVTGRSDFNTNKDKAPGLTIVYEIVSPDDDVLEQLGASINSATGVFKFDSLDAVCIGDEFQFLIQATTYKGDVVQETATLAFNVTTIGPVSTVQIAALADFDVSSQIPSAGDDLDVLTFDFNALSIVGSAFDTNYLPFFGSEDINLLCIRFSGEGSTRYVELDQTVEYIYFGSTEQYNGGEPTIFPASIFEYELNKIYEINHSASIGSNELNGITTVDGSEIACDQLIYGVYAERETVTETHLTGGAGNDLIFGSQIGDNYLDGGAGDDFIIALNSLGKNLLRGGGGADTIIGSEGKDTFVYHSADFDGSKDAINATDLDSFTVSGVEFIWDLGAEQWVNDGSAGYVKQQGTQFLYYEDINSSGLWFATQLNTTLITA